MNKIKNLIRKTPPIKQFLKLREKIDLLIRLNQEILFAHIFQDTIVGSNWLKKTSFSPYLGAANYSFLYKLFKIFDTWQPKNILEFGLGQTTKITSQYVAYRPHKAQALIIESDQKWIDLYKKNLSLSPKLKIVKKGTTSFIFKGEKILNCRYQDLSSTVKNKKFDFIIIDGPLGGRICDRTNIIDLLKDNLAKDFIIIFDDAERVGETNTIKLVETKLKKLKVDFASFRISAKKDQYLICAKTIYPLIFAI